MSDITDLIAAINTQKASIDSLVQQMQDNRNPPRPRNEFQRTASGTSISLPTSGLSNPINLKNTQLGLDKLAASMGLLKTLGGAAVQVLDELGTYGMDKYDPIQRAFGGLGDGLNSVNETSRNVVDSIDNIYAAYYANDEAQADFMVMRHGQQVNAAYAFFKNETEIANSFLRIRENLALRQSVMLNQMTAQEQTRLGMFSKGLRFTNREVAEIMERQISKTGEASNEIFLNISKFAKATSDATGISFQEITAGIADIITDVETFGNVSEEQAARIAANLGEIGLSVRGFGQMVDKFMNFDTAAESLGNLSTVFGVHFDAMEMMMLSATDPEEFLHQMRESFLDAGLEIEDMTLPEKRLAAQQLSMSVTEFENFMQEGRVMTDLQRETEAAKRLDGFQTMTEQMAIEGKSLEQMTEHLQRKVFDSLSRDAYKVGVQFETMKGKLVLKPEEFLPGYEQYFHTVRESLSAVAGGREEYQDEYAAVLKLIETVAPKNREQQEFLDNLAKTRKEHLTAVTMLEAAIVFPDFSAKILQQTAGVASAGRSIGTDIGKQIEQGLTIDEATTAANIAEKLKAVGAEIEAGGAGGMGAQSPSPRIGIPIMYGIIHGVTDLLTHPGNKALIDEGLASFGDYVNRGIDNAIVESENPLIKSIAEGDANIAISAEGAFSDIVEQLKISQDKSDEVMTKMKSEEAENLRIAAEAVKEHANVVKGLVDKETILQTIVNLDSNALVNALKNWKGSDGSFIKFVVPR